MAVSFGVGGKVLGDLSGVGIGSSLCLIPFYQMRALFTHSEMIAELAKFADAVSPPIEMFEFSASDFESEGSEEEIQAFRGSKLLFSSGLRFWVKSLQTLGWSEGDRETYFLPYAERGLCKRINQNVFNRIVTEHSRSLKQPLPSFLRNLEGFQSGLQMYSDWNDVAAVAELTESFVSFFWKTSA